MHSKLFSHSNHGKSEFWSRKAGDGVRVNYHTVVWFLFMRMAKIPYQPLSILANQPIAKGSLKTTSLEMDSSNTNGWNFRLHNGGQKYTPKKPNQVVKTKVCRKHCDYTAGYKHVNIVFRRDPSICDPSTAVRSILTGQHFASIQTQRMQHRSIWSKIFKDIL